MLKFFLLFYVLILCSYVWIFLLWFFSSFLLLQYHCLKHGLKVQKQEKNLCDEKNDV